jgi:peptide chain release factor 1
VTDQFAATRPLLAEHAEIEAQLADPAVHADAARARSLGRRYAELNQVVGAYRAWRDASDDAEAAAELADEDEGFAAELPALRAVADEAAERLRRVLVPRDPDDGRDVILEIKAGEGGEESALFAGDLLRMYLRYAERRGWKTEVIEATESDLGGYKDVQVAVRHGPPRPRPSSASGRTSSTRAACTACSASP